MERLSRRSFVKIAGVAAGTAAIGAAPPLARAAAGHDAEQVEPATGVPEEPLVAYVRDVERGEVTVVSGTRETTYHDRTLVQRLSKAARSGEGAS